MKLGYVLLFLILMSCISLKLYLKTKLNNIDGLGGTALKHNQKEKLIKIQ